MLTTLRILKLAISSALLLAVVADDPGSGLDPPPVENVKEFQVELCDKPCANNGICIAFDSDNDGVLDPQCFCNTTFEGDLCETPSTCSLACENGGACSLGNAWWLTEDEDSFEFFKELLFVCSLEEGEAKRCPLEDMQERCDCPPGTNGPLCENTCDLTCENGGECSFLGSGQRCRCPDSFYGDQCENVCSKGCLNNGVCFGYGDDSGGFEEQCICPAGFEGDLCETVAPCPLSCENDGVCKFVGSWLFEEVFNSEYWESTFEGCRDLPISECLIFQEEETRPYCECPPNTIGNTCELVCDHDCQNGSTCQFYNGRSKICSCETGFAGDLCQFECTKGCVNGACNANATAQWCQCSPYHDGDLCETERACEKTCFNDGKCGFREYNEKYFQECIYQKFNNCPGPEDVQRCTCTNDFVGSDCSQSCPCQNGGTCRNWYNNRKLEQVENDELFNGNYYDETEEYIDGDGYENLDEEEAGYFCQCSFGFYGRDCQFKYGSEYCALDCENGGYCQAEFDRNDEDGWEGEQNYNNGNSNNQNYYYPNGEEIQNGRQSNNQDDSNGDDTPTPQRPTPAPQRPFEYCVCPSGFIGRSCETEIDACGNQCKNGGICSTETTSTQGLGNRALQASPGSATDPSAFAPTVAPISPPPSSCSCPEGYSGAFCERKACGSGYCSHGGTCIELPAGQTTSAEDDYVCDCSTSILEETVGIGRNCDAIVSGTCPWMNTKLNPNEPWVCAGYGRCYKDADPTSAPECYCGTEMYTGPRCEFNITNPKDVAWSECSLQCSNDGICLKGAAKPIAEIFIPFIEGTKKSGLFDYETPEFEYCYCPDGFFGVQCDKQYDICGNRDHICFHGSKCKNDGGEWGCDCEGTESAGLYCQYKATDDCGDSNLETFCANEAMCILDSSSNAVCACSEGWEGSKCETEVKLASTSGGGGEWSSASVAGRLVSMLSIAIFSIALVVL